MDEQEPDQILGAEQQTVIHLSERDSVIFIEALLTPAAPSDKLRAAVADYFAFVGEEADEGLRRDLLKRKEQ